MAQTSQGHRAGSLWRRYRTPLTAVLLAIVASSADAKVVNKTVEYEQDGVTLEGYLAWDDAAEGPRPGATRARPAPACRWRP